MKILAFDTSNQPLVVSLGRDTEVVQQYETNQPRSHSIQLLPAIQHLLHEQGWQLTDLDRIVVAQGPGSFTGLRIGVTVGKVLADTLNIPLVGVSSLAILATQIPGNSLVVPIFDARNQNVFAGVYQNGHNLLADGHYPIQTVLNFLGKQSGAVTFLGDTQNFVDLIMNRLNDQVVTILAPEDSLPNGDGIIQLGLKQTPVENIADFNPNYLRKTQAELNWLAQHPGEDRPEDYVFEV
ncbi:tRNA (adenosine(37)-N6)-threonylcarbamoyltransferase complex dimerization subunit type 1 TsaB [Convivina praedatoris]|uniref:tRNA threonylcarbamoyladenosine biosynthesis protein TsaB n=1 Tax=Convivina praedatoris TaxID=2880963 RepID=A0ABM9D2V9_9LACO|nr:tRNA (adenosine(37)-N6)-threonylcarbamoyltransferase complex dimerization subunit type 1 TsaB [Convivina sp. LMG 32447]CAH1852372.1 tRNA threonylcarbamoyladenosine biosynthesis protein TsaB [Convivina sp. LMG 32447]CAH1852413.1 tRNA threonylcarbamoyladenosine biosynthesis protein TsaB [Convivina sp. LMG 32447]CAH1855195.1 tRNA threonylcarbamoyladenosine biosynthesis protein TsaB [Convivina sp. LMG 32447]